MARYPKNSTPKLNKKLIYEMADLVRNGNYIETAAAFCGISKDTLYRWFRQARNPEANPILVELSYAVKRALAESEMRDIEVIAGAAEKGDWRAAAWRLERKHREHWGRTSIHSTVDVSCQTTALASCGEISKSDMVMTTETLNARFRALSKKISE